MKENLNLKKQLAKLQKENEFLKTERLVTPNTRPR